MFFSRLWNYLSIRKKVWGLVLLPTIVILSLSGKQVIEVNNQLTSLEKSTHVAKAIAQLKDLNQESYESRLTATSTSNNKQAIKLNELAKTTSVIFSKQETSEYQKLIEQYQETIDAIDNAEDLESKYDATQWQTDVYKEFLLAIEKTHFKAPIEIVDDNLKALLQLEWLAFWVQEEIWQSTMLISTQDASLKMLIRDKMSSLIQNQQLFVERFVAINADNSQVKLLLAAFSNIAFEKSNTFREQLLNDALTTNISAQQVKEGNQAFSQRLSLFQDVALSIENQLKQDIHQSVSTFIQYRILFFGVIALFILMVVSFGIALAKRITANLSTVLAFLDHKGDLEKDLKLHIPGNDELSKFAVEVERLAIEHQNNQKELITAKDDAVKAKETAINASKAKSSFLANMSHEIRTPLNGVIGISEILSSTKLNATQKDYVDTIEVSSQLLLSLINDILDFSKIESGKLPISPYSTDFRESIYDIAAIVTPKIKEKGITLHINIEKNVPLLVMADDHRIRQVLMNLMSNAVKFTDTGSITISIKHEQEDNNSLFIFEVTDTGIGINEAQKKKIFEPFSQEDNSTTREFGGTGLGLAISTQLIELMGGKLCLDSEKGKGSRFYFSLPLNVPKQNIEKYTLLDETQVILVCDNSQISQALIEELEFLGVTLSDHKLSLQEVTTQPKKTSTQTSQIVIYAVDSEKYKSINIKQLQEYNQGRSALCLVHPINVKPVNFEQSISSLITYPLLGKRLRKALERAYEMVSSSHNKVINLNPSSVNKSKKVLIVDDNKINQKIASLHIKNLGYEYDIANDGEEAVTLFHGNEYALVLMDCMMPIKDGFTATKEIREFEVQNNKLRTTIIALTASVIQDDIQNCFTSGMDDYLTKPFDPEMLKNRINNALADNDQELSLDEDSNTSNIPVIAPISNKEPQSQIRILLVEDNRINQKVATLLLKKFDYQYVIANNGQEAIDIYAKDHHFDAILMDLMMPIKDGFEASIEIRSYEKTHNLPPIPIIAVTASVVNDDIQQCFKSGMTAYIPKPIQAEKLQSEISNCLNIKG